MVLVIIGHAIQTVMQKDCFNDHVFNLIYSFHMPAFISISGWFSYHKIHRGGYLDVCLRRSKQLLMPYVLWSLLQWGISDRSTSRLWMILSHPDSFFWFLWVLFWICCIFTLCRWIADMLKIDELIPIGLTAILLIGMMVGMEFRLFGFQFLAYYFLFYTLGYCIHRFSIMQIKNNFIIAALVVIWTILAWYWNMHELPSWFPTIPHVPSILLQYAYRGMTAIVAMFALFGIAPQILDSASRFNQFVQSIGISSLGLYIIHLLFIGYVLELMQNLIPNIPIWCMIGVVFTMTFIISVIFVKLIERKHWMAFVLFGKS